MPSPFPGMDPYLEAHWGDIHHRIINYACDAIQEQLPGDLFARMEERIYVQTPREIMERYPDVRVVARSTVPGVPAAATAEGIVLSEPLVLELCGDPVTEGFIEIRETGHGERLVTVIEVLSPANKVSGAGRRQYRRKQKEIQQSDVNLVEIDLLRAGNWTVLAGRDLLPKELQAPYRICVWRYWRPLSIEFYHAPQRERLPAIRLPLRERDNDVALDLQALIDRSYRYGRYEATDYAADPEPPLEGKDADGGDSLLRQHGLRK